MTRKHPEIKCCVECKHYSRGIDVERLFGKLAMAKTMKGNIDHWILVSPHANLTNDAKIALEERKRDYPFDIHIWTQENGVEEFFGIIPEVFESFYVLPPGLEADPMSNPRLWSEARRKWVIEKWLDKLPPKYRFSDGRLLPEHWVTNLRNADKKLISCEGGENPHQMKKEWQLAVQDGHRMCINEDGTTGSLLSQFMEWLHNDENRILALLGDFGSGKTLHSYSLGIETARRFLENPAESRIPIRLTLKNCRNGEIREVLTEQLYDLRGSYEEVTEMNLDGKLLFILDGFDEMSRHIGDTNTEEQFNRLYRFCSRFKDAKICLTCRTHYFKSAEQEFQFFESLKMGKGYDNITKLYLGKFTGKEIANCVRKRCREVGEEREPGEVLAKMNREYDLMGMSANPLILSMITEILDLISSERGRISQTYIYETYVDDWLEREMNKLKKHLNPGGKKVKDGLKKVMGILAYLIYKKEDFELSYDQLKGALSGEFEDCSGTRKMKSWGSWMR